MVRKFKDDKIYYKSGYKYQLNEDYVIEIPGLVLFTTDKALSIKPLFINMYFNFSNTLWIRSGYAWDGASGPTIDVSESMRASLVHDALYQLIREGFLLDSAKELADDVFYKLLLEDGMWKPKAWLWYQAVKCFGGEYLEKEKEILIAPGD